MTGEWKLDTTLSPGRRGEIPRPLIHCWSADGMAWGDQFGKSRKTENASLPLPCSLIHGSLSCVINCHATSDVFFITYCRICKNKSLWRLCSISLTYVSQVTDPTPLGSSEKRMRMFCVLVLIPRIQSQWRKQGGGKYALYLTKLNK